ncbi:MAG: type VI secretion system tip protein TssI/VgrG [Desulfobulbus sp.]
MTSVGKKFSFASMAATLAADTFDVVSFTGTEGLSKLYHFDVTLVSDNDEIDLESVIQSRATLTILRDDGNIVFNGMLSAFEQMETAQGLTHYRAVLTPAFWRLTLTYHNQIFLNKTTPQIIEAALQDGGLTSLDYELRLTGDYQPDEYVCQYNESHYNFVSRLMEREGIYYYFEQDAESEKLIITDTSLLHSVMAEGKTVFYSQTSGLDEEAREEVVKSLVCSQRMLPARVLLKDYNYRKPSLELSVEHVVSERGFGDVFIYGEHFSTPEEGTQLAKVRAEALICRARVFQGVSLIPYLRPGYLVELVGHNREDFNDTYLTTDITHNGDQTFLFTSGLGAAGSTRERFSAYHNSFTAISSSNQFRPERVTEKPRIPGTMNAHIDAAGSGQYAEVDDQGRYKVILPFDLNNAMGGKASSWLRMAQPYAGENHGMHFPLHKGTEVLLTFIDGDPDRPIIASAVPNPITPSPVTSTNSTQSRITTAGGNKLHIEDQQGGERILLHTPKQNSWIRMGTPNDPEGDDSPSQEEINEQQEKTNEKLEEKIKELEDESANSGIKLSSTAGFEVECAFENKLVMGEQTEFTIGSKNDVLLGTETAIKLASALEVFLGVKADATIGTKIEMGRGNVYTNFKENELIGSEKVEIKAGGASPAVVAAMTAMFIASTANTALVAGLGISQKGNAGSKAAVVTGDIGLTAIAAAISGLIASGTLDLAEKLSYASSIELDLHEIEMESPKIKMEALLTGISMTAVAGGIKSTATLGGITNTATAGGITNKAVEGGISNTAVAGGITNKADVENITNTATVGNLTNTAGVNLKNEAEATITNTGKFNKLLADVSLTMQSSGTAKIDADTNLTVNAGIKMGMSAPNINIDAGASIAITAGAILKLG